jgi:ABC-type multidrug transport system fused ATPase/permease subunit
VTARVWRGVAVFAALSVFMGLRLALIMLPLSISLFAAAKVSLSRVEDYLALPEHDEAVVACDAAAATPSDGCLVQISSGVSAQSNAEEGGFGMSFKWPDADFQLRNIHLAVCGGEMVGIAGPIGSGKSSLLSAILGEMPPTSQSRSPRQHLTQSVCFVGQRPFLLSGTVRENITMGLLHGGEERVLDACARAALAQDLTELADGLETIVGERGVTLSGGQQQVGAVGAVGAGARCACHPHPQWIDYQPTDWPTG